MPTSLSDLKTWLQTPNHVRRILVEITSVTDLSGSNPATIYLSNGAYTTRSTDSPANTSYLPVISGGISFTQNLSVDGNISISYGDIELDNTNGSLDSYLNKIFVKKEITIYIGDPNWPKADYKILFKGSVVDLLARSRQSLNIVISDKLSNLNTSLSETTVVQEFKNNAEDLVPVCFGECFNVSPLINQTTEPKTYYIVHNGPIEDIIEVRDMGLPISNKTINNVSVSAVSNMFTTTVSHGIRNGIPIRFSNITGVVGISSATTYYVISSSSSTFKISTAINGGEVDITTGGTVTLEADIAYTKDLTNGRFILNQSTFGQVTCSVQGDKPSNTYTNSLGTIIKNILKNHGPASTRLTDSDLDLTSFNAYTNTIGYYSSSKENILEVCNKLASSIRAKLSVNVGPLATDSDVGKIKILQLNEATTSLVTILPKDVEQYSMSIGEVVNIRAATKLNYCKNWTVQTSGLAAGVPESSKSLLNNEWLSETATNNATLANYKLSDTPQAEDTYLIVKSQAVTESTTRNSLWSKKRIIYNMVCYPHLFDIKLGDFVKLTNQRFNLNETLGTVVNTSIDWINGRIELGVLV